MVKVLILAYDFPPYISIGAQRPYSWYKYFPDSNFYPVIVTRHWDEDLDDPNYYLRSSSKREIQVEASEHGKIIKVPYTASVRDRLVLKFGMNRFSLLRKMLSLVESILKFLSFRFDNTKPIYDAADNVLRSEKVDWIIATGEPFILFRYAKLLSSKYKIPWLADYRDCWSTDNSDFAQPLMNRIVFHLFYQRFEKNIVNSASLITTAAPGYRASLQTLFPDKDIKVLFNGYDNETLDSLSAGEQRKDVFEIAYAGTIYHNQNLEMFLEGFRQFIQEHNDARVHLAFYGLDFYPEQKERLLSFDESLNQYFSTSPKMPYREILIKLQKAHLLLLLSKKHWNKLAGKIFDYLALNRKVLLVENDHAILASILDECHGGEKFDSARDVKKCLKKYYAEFLKNSQLQHRSDHFKKYSRRHQSKRLTDWIRSFT